MGTRGVGLCVSLLVLAPLSARAASITDGTPIAGLSWPTMADGSVEGSNGRTHIDALAPYVNPQAYRLPASFNFDLRDWSLTMLLEMAGYQDINALSLCTDATCHPVFDGVRSAGSSTTTRDVVGTARSTRSHHFTLTTVGHQWSSQPSGNWDGLDHFVAFQVHTSAVVTIRRTRRQVADSPLTFTLAAGDLVIGIEDLGGPFGQNSDRDFNDLLFLASAPPPPTTQDGVPVPEPATFALVALGLLGAAPFRRRRERAARRRDS